MKNYFLYKQNKYSAVVVDMVIITFSFLLNKI